MELSAKKLLVLKLGKLKTVKFRIVCANWVKPP